MEKKFMSHSIPLAKFHGIKCWILSKVVLQEAFVACLPIPMYKPLPRPATSNLWPFLLQVRLLECKRNVLHLILILRVLKALSNCTLQLFSPWIHHSKSQSKYNFKEGATSRNVVMEHQATIAKLGAHMGLVHQLGSQGPCGHQVLQL
jgi:hypothetical protein